MLTHLIVTRVLKIKLLFKLVKVIMEATGIQLKMVVEWCKQKIFLIHVLKILMFLLVLLLIVLNIMIIPSIEDEDNDKDSGN